MKTRHFKMTTALVSGALLVVLFQNGSMVNWEEATLEKTDLNIRNEHARELLGKGYDRSAASLHEDNQQLSLVILNHVKASLPKSHIKQAGPLAQAIISESRTHGFDPFFVLAVIKTESQFNPVAVGSVGEIGLMQIRPETAQWIAGKSKIKWAGAQSLKNPVTNVKLGVAYMSWLRTQMGTNSVRYVAAYNMGPKAVRRLVTLKIRPKDYRNRVLTNYEQLYKSAKPLSRAMTTAGL